MKFVVLLFSILAAAAVSFAQADPRGDPQVDPMKGDAMIKRPALDVVVIPPNAVVTPQFQEGAELGPGVVEKDIMTDPPKSKIIAHAKPGRGNPASGAHLSGVAGNIKRFKFDERLTSFVQPRKRIMTAVIRPESPVTSARAPASVAAFPEDKKFSNDVIEGVREKDRKDYAETLSIVQKAILRGDYGETARERLKHELGK